MIVGAGKAAAEMARTTEEHWPRDATLGGLVVTRYGHAVPCTRIQVVEASHPLPDRAGIEAAQRVLELVRDLSSDDLALVLLSGGASSLLALPPAGISLADKQQVGRALLRCGASIREINCVRKHLSAIKGGRLAAACSPARVVTLAISDVPGDDPAVIGSGPTLADPSTCGEARAILERYRLAIPAHVADYLASAAAETIKPGDPRLEGAVTTIVASARESLAAALRVARAHDLEPLVLGDSIEGDAATLGRHHAALALDLSRAARGPRVILSGGETTVAVRGPGRGGRNTEYLLALASALRGHPRISAIAIDTDGIDGTEDNAGAFVVPDTLARATALGLDAGSHLVANDAYSFFRAIGDLVVTGPTRTNVNDFRAIHIGGADST